MTIIYIIILLLVIFIVYKSTTSKKDLFEKYSKDLPIDENVMKDFKKKYDACDNENCQTCDRIADINEDYILPTIHLNIINPDETKYILDKSKNNFKDSVIVSGNNTNIRKSKTSWLNKNDPIVKKIIMRVCNLTNSSFENVENLQVVKYEKEGYYNEHFDTVTSNSDNEKHFLSQGGHRLITMLIYLNDDFTEGGTKFVFLNKVVKPPKYSGILFYTFDKKMIKCHPKSYHAGLPIKSGNKYIANVWIRQYKYPEIY